MTALALDRYKQAIDHTTPFPVRGYVTNSLGLVIEAYCPEAKRGAICEVSSADGLRSCEAEVVGFSDDKAILMPLGDPQGIGMGSLVRLKSSMAGLRVGPELIGRVIDALGRPLDGGPDPEVDEEFRIYAKPINPLRRERITQALDLGVRSINSLLTIGKGQRMAIMAGSGVGKSILMGMMARSTSADVSVIALVGERGREVREFIEEILGKEGMEKSVVVVATSDSPPLIRMRAAFVATTIAEYFRSLGKDVLLMMDSVTRFAMAQREVGLAAGEPPTTKGYPPSVFGMLPQLFERAGNLVSGGSITGIYTVLIEADDLQDPIGDTVRSIVDGHIFLSRKLASLNHYPAIDVANSVSRVMPQVVSPNQMSLAARLKAIMAVYSEAEDLINIGAYVKGSNKQIDESIRLIEPIKKFLIQSHSEKVDMDRAVKELAKVFEAAK